MDGGGLTAATYLGENTVAALDSLLEVIRDRIGLAVAVDPAAGRSSSEARRHAAGVDLLWLCGGLFATLRSQGVLPHQAVAAPVFEGEADATYRSVVVARRDGPHDLEDALQGTLAVNEHESWSGHHALRRLLGERWFAGGDVLTGAHTASLQAVAEGGADCAAIDSSIWRWLSARRPTLVAPLTVIAATPEWPSPPLALRPGLPDAQRAALATVICSSGPLPGVSRFEPTDAAAYDGMRLHISPSGRVCGRW